MTNLTILDAYGALTEPATLKLQRLLPGPIERIWAYLTESDLRQRWLASGQMEMRVGADFELTWRNNELTDPPGQRPPGFSDEHRMWCRIVEIDPPRRLVFTFGTSGEVSFHLDPQDGDVLLTVIHRRLPERAVALKVSAGWHTHLDVLVARVTSREPEPYWDEWTRLHAEYDGRLPA
jgi:uncharacterized protein YndB with AHSA1/START domain